MNKAYSRINWENSPSEGTPLNERNLNRMDAALDEIDDRVLAMRTTKLDKVDAQTLVKSIAFDRAKGTFTITYFNNTAATIDTMLEKLMVNFIYDYQTQQLVITLDNGDKQYVDLSALITQYEFLDSDAITFALSADGKISAKVKEGSIDERHLRPDYLADIRVESASAAGSAQAASGSAASAGTSRGAAAASAEAAESHERMAQSYAVGTGGEVRENDDSDSAKGYYEQSRRLAQGFNGIVPMGTVTFAELSDPANQVPKYMFNVSDAFTSDERFTDGGGVYYGAGNNVVFTADGKWDALAASAVTGVKGAAEASYRQGNVSITAEDIGIVAATDEKAGIVRPDGETTAVDPDGTLHVIGNEGTIDYNELENKPSINGHGLEGDKTLEQIGGASVIRLTKAEYEALPEGKLTDGKLYLIEDGEPEGGPVMAKRRGISITGDITGTSKFDPATGNTVIQTQFASYSQSITHRNTFRGKSLGSTFTAAQKAAIADGSFRDLYVGDYWEINGFTWRIVDINYWINCGDIAPTVCHLAIMPDESLYGAKMNEANTTVGGYVGSKMYKEGLDQAKEIIIAAFGSANILTHREYLTNAVTDGYPSAGAWYDSTVELPNEIMMSGSYVNTPTSDGTIIPSRYTIDRAQLALMNLHPMFINPKRQYNWLRDVASENGFAYVNAYGGISYNVASVADGVRPVFGIKG